MTKEEFLSMLKTSEGCIFWELGKTSTGYGKVNIEGRNMKAHRAAYSLTKGNIPDGLDVCHTCDNPSCINPNHLFLGTPSDNLQDASRKGKFKRSKFSKGDVNMMRSLYSTKLYTQRDLARMYSCSVATINIILRNINYFCKE